MAWNFTERSGDILRNIVIVGLYIALKLTEDKMLVECWVVYCFEIDRKSEAY